MTRRQNGKLPVAAVKRLLTDLVKNLHRVLRSTVN